ncbi:hypothetical protein ACKVMT_14290 [Halobacteriales archaeon Cl-PHB]
MRRTAMVVLAVAAVALAGCSGPAGAPSGTDDGGKQSPTVTPTATPAENCTITSGRMYRALPVDSNVSDVDGEVVAYANLSAAQQELFRQMHEQYHKAGNDLLADYPDYVRYNDTVYEPQPRGHWDEFC